MTPVWSIIIPVKPGGQVRALEALRGINYPAELVEIIVSEGNHPSTQRNRAASYANGERLYFLDDDSIINPDFLKIADTCFVDPQVAAVGGPSLTPVTDTLFQQAFGASLSSLIGGGSVRNRYRKFGSPRNSRENELILCNLGFRRQLFLQYGGLNELLYPNEENELMDRIIQGGWKLVHHPALAVTRSQRRSYQSFVKQLFTYGRGRGEQTVISGRINPVSLVPSLFILYLLLIPAIDNPVYTIPLLCYAGAVTLTALLESLKRRILPLFPLLMLVIPTLHLTYGAGMFLGLVRPRFRNRGNMPVDVSLRRVTI